MAVPTLSPSGTFFKDLSLEYQQLHLTIQLIQTFVFRAVVRGHELGDQHLLLILDQLEMLIAKAGRLMDEMEGPRGGR